MITIITESNVVGEIDATVFSLIQSGPVLAAIVIKNVGSNIMNYRFQSFDGVNWNDMDQPGTLLNNTLAINQVVSQVVTAAVSQVRLVGNASGGTILDFDVTRYFARADGGALPLLNL
jgi:hypothetical protein